MRREDVEGNGTNRSVGPVNAAGRGVRSGQDGIIRMGDVKDEAPMAPKIGGNQANR